MVGNYEIRQGTSVIGTVEVKKQGLYYCFSCRCRLSGEVIHRLEVIKGGEITDLGVCVPMEGCFGTEKRVPVKVFRAGEAEFRLVPKHESVSGLFVPVYPDEPFAYLSRLKEAFLVRQNGQLGIVIR